MDCILETTFLDRQVRAILPLQRKIVFHHAPSEAMTGMTPSRHDRLMEWKSPAQQPRPTSTVRKEDPFPRNTLSRKVQLVKVASIRQMNQALDFLAAHVGSLCFL